MRAFAIPLESTKFGSLEDLIPAESNLLCRGETVCADVCVRIAGPMRDSIVSLDVRKTMWIEQVLCTLRGERLDLKCNYRDRVITECARRDVIEIYGKNEEEKD